jgi:hypothetical protein
LVRYQVYERATRPSYGTPLGPLTLATKSNTRRLPISVLVQESFSKTTVDHGSHIRRPSDALSEHFHPAVKESRISELRQPARGVFPLLITRRIDHPRVSGTVPVRPIARQRPSRCASMPDNRYVHESLFIYNQPISDLTRTGVCSSCI